MIRPDAIAMDAATCFDVIPLQAFGGFANKEVVSLDGSAAHLKPTVPENSLRQPKSAAVRTTRIDMGPEALFGGTKRCDERVAVGMPTSVVLTAPTTRQDRLRATFDGAGVVVRIRGHREPDLSDVMGPDVSASRPRPILQQEVP